MKAHLEAVRERSSVAKAAGDRVSGIIETAERTAAEIEQAARQEAKDAQREAAETQQQAWDEAQRILSAARSEAKEHAERAEAALTRLVDEAEGLRNAVARIAEDVTTEFPGSTTEALDTTPDRALPGEAPTPQRSFRFRRPDAPAPGRTGDAHAEAADAAEPEVAGTVKTEADREMQPKADDEVEPEAAAREGDPPPLTDLVDRMRTDSSPGARVWRRRRRPTRGS